MVVRIIKDWNSPDIFRQTPDGDKIWDEVEFTTDEIREFDYLVVLNTTNKEVIFKCRKNGKFLFTQEPPIPRYKWHKKIFKYVDEVFTSWDIKGAKIINNHGCLPWHINKTYDELINLEPNDGFVKQDKISWITSNLRLNKGHILRMDFKDKIEGHLDFDLFGRGFKEIDDKFDVVYPYKYSFAIENSCYEDYWTEKIADCFLSWTIPIYYGCPNISKYFPENSMIHIDPSKPEEAVKIIQKAMDENFWEKNFDSLKEARELVLHKYQLFPFIANKVNNMKHQRRVWSYLPKNVADNSIDETMVFKNQMKMKIKNILNV